MTPERWQQISELFQSALDIAADGRAAYLDAVCAEDRELRREVERLLGHDAATSADGFLERRPTAPSTVTDDLVGRRVGPYLVRERVGRGGMGVVYRAERQTPFYQEVALKVPLASSWLAELPERLARERQLLAGVAHPCVARLLDGGSTDDGRPYLVLEFVPGPPLDVYCDRENLDLRGRVGLLVQVCDAVQAAHEAGVLHRDLKPANVLVAPDGTPKVTDFGVGRRLGEDGGTEPGRVLGTPSYLPPEQAGPSSAPPGPAADVYGLGAIFYELLAGRPPFKGTSRDDTLEQVRTCDPVPPRRLSPRVPRDLDTICLKCLEKDPRRRYPSAAALAEDLRRFLDGRPVRARPVRSPERAWRWCSRNPLAAALIATLLLGAAGGLAAVTAQGRRASARERLARQAADDMMRVGWKWLENEPNLGDEQLRLLERALASYQELIRGGADDADLLFRTAQAHHFLGRFHAWRAQRPRASEHYRRQRALLDELLHREPDEKRYRFDLFHCLINLAGCGDRAEGDACQTAAFAVIRRLADDHPDDPLVRDALVSQTLHMGDLSQRNGDAERAREHFGAARTHAEQLDREYPERSTPPYFAAGRAASLMRLTGAAWSAGRVDEALAFGREGVAVSRALAVRVPADPALRAEAVFHARAFAGMLLDAGRTDEAGALCEAALPWAEDLARRFPKRSGWRSTPADLSLTLGLALWDAGRRSEAEGQLERAFAEMERVRADADPNTFPRTGLATLLLSCPAERLRRPQETLEIFRKAVEAEDTAANRVGLGVALLRAGDAAGAVRRLRAEEGMREGLSVESRFFLALAQHRAGDPDGARATLAEAVQRMDQSPLPNAALRRLRAETEARVGVTRRAGAR